MKKRKWLGATILSVGMCFSALMPVATAKEVNEQELLRVLITASDSDKKVLKESYGVHREFNSEGFTVDLTEKQYKALQNKKNLSVRLVETASIEAPPTNTAQAVPTNQVPWGIKAIYKNNSLSQSSGGDGIKVAVLDTGVYKSHIDLVQNVEQCKDFTQTKSPLVNNSCNDRNGHGTHVAGSVLANGGTDGQGIYGVAPEAELWAYKVLNDRGSGYSDDIAYAIRHAADQATSTSSKVIISMSLGSSAKDSLIASAVDYAYSKGVLIIAAAGNSGPSANTIGYPGALSNVVAVAALENVQENGTYRVANFSSRGNPLTDGDYIIQEKDVEVSAPGAAIESTWMDGGYNTISGTSMATPHVSGLAAKIWSANKSLTSAQVRAELQNRAKSNDINGGQGAATGDDYASGYGFPTVN
ncbi:S8 family peptidase [Peribacillus acanthi]|uniref:S8 family peptidase n=1 Tax=Peribacillus acanthi TaxID=2171554 RepID=UPI000D3E946C|nr:S8 family peptidase [Peribacillus acanthi]